MLSAPIKTSKTLDWEPALSHFIRADFGVDPALHANDFQILNNARQRASQVIVGDEVSIDSIRKYLCMLVILQERFKLKQMDAKQTLSLQFSWSDAFRPKQKVVSSSECSFERVNMMYNLACLYGQAGINLDLKTVESIKTGSSMFARSAGVFSALLEDEDRPHLTLTCDLSNEGLTMLKFLMLAQTQVCFYERALLDEMRPSTLSKVCFQSSKFFELALAQTKLPVLQRVLDPAWQHHLEFNKRKHEMLSCYHFASQVKRQAKETGNGYGELVAWLSKAEQLGKASNKFVVDNKLPSGLGLPVKQLLEKVTYELEQAIEDNNKIYFASIPSELPPLTGHILAKEIPFDLASSGSTNNGELIFKNLFVQWMRNAQESFAKELEQKVSELGARVQAKTNEIRQGLQDCNLPASVETPPNSASATENRLPEAVWQRISQAKSLHKAYAENVASNQFLAQKVSRLEKDLREEERLGHASKQVPSKQLNQSMFRDLTQFANLLQQAASSDASLLVKLQDLHLLSKSREELEALLPVVHSVQDSPRVEELRLELSMLLIELGSRIQQVEEAHTLLMEQTHNVSIIAQLDTADKVQEVKRNAMDQFDFSQVEAKLSSMQAVFSSVLQRNFEFQEIHVQSENKKKRVQFLSSIDLALDKHREALLICKEGAKFYAELGQQIHLCEEVVGDFCFVRNLEREEHQEQTTASSQERRQTAAQSQEILAQPSFRSVSVVNPKVEAMRAVLGVESNISDSVLDTYLVQANGNLDEAVNRFFENPPPAPTPKAGRAAPPPPGSSGGWFQ